MLSRAYEQALLYRELTRLRQANHREFTAMRGSYCRNFVNTRASGF
jgi:hypothetical protein